MCHENNRLSISPEIIKWSHVKMDIPVYSCTVKHSKAVLGGGRQRLAGGVQLVSIVANADLKLDWLTRLLEHARTVEHSAQRVLPPPLIFLK